VELLKLFNHYYAVIFASQRTEDDRDYGKMRKNGRVSVSIEWFLRGRKYP
jgi:hypothetical protein